MPLPTVHEALIYLMVVASASDRDMSDAELARIGEVVRAWPVFEDFDSRRLVGVAQDCQIMLHEGNGLDDVLDLAKRVIPARLHDTAYAAVFEVVVSDLEMRMEEVRVLQRLREALELDPLAVAAIELANKARHRTLT
ncbi:MAG TPA: tellurite resistance TerB family protein [Mesorhizobium sp.]